MIENQWLQKRNVLITKEVMGSPYRSFPDRNEFKVILFINKINPHISYGMFVVIKKIPNMFAALITD